MTTYLVTAWKDGKRQYSSGYGRQPTAACTRFRVQAEASDDALVAVDQLGTFDRLEAEVAPC